MVQLNETIPGEAGEFVEVNDRSGSTDSESGMQKIVRAPLLSDFQRTDGMDVVYRCIAVAAASENAGALRDDISKVLVTEPNYVASWFFEWDTLVGRPTVGAFQDGFGRPKSVPPAYKEAVHRALALRVGNRADDQLVDFDVASLDPEPHRSDVQRAKASSRCIFLPVKVREKVVSGLVVCTDKAELLDSTAITLLRQVTKHVAQRLGELEILSQHQRVPGESMANRGQKNQPSAASHADFSPSQRPTIPVGEEQSVHYLNVTLPASVADKSHLLGLGGSGTQKPALAQARSLVHDLNNHLSVILTYSDTKLLPAPPPPELAEDLEIIRKAGQEAAELVRRLHQLFEEY